MEKVTTISNTISAVAGAAVSIGALVYCYKLWKCLSDDLNEEKNQVKK